MTEFAQQLREVVSGLTQAETVLSTEMEPHPDPQVEADLRTVYELVEKANAIAFRVYQEHESDAEPEG